MKKSFLFRLSLGLLGMGALCSADVPLYALPSVADKESTRHVKLGKLDFELEKVNPLYHGTNQYWIVGPSNKRSKSKTIIAYSDTDEDLKKQITKKVADRFLLGKDVTYVPYAGQTEAIKADYGVFEKYITQMFGRDKEDLGNGYSLYRDNEPYGRMIISKQDDQGISFIFNFNGPRIDTEYFIKLDSDSKDFIFNSGKSRAQGDINYFPITYASISKDNKNLSLSRDNNGRLEIKEQSITGGDMFNKENYVKAVFGNPSFKAKTSGSWFHNDNAGLAIQSQPVGGGDVLNGNDYLYGGKYTYQNVKSRGPLKKGNVKRIERSLKRVRRKDRNFKRQIDKVFKNVFGNALGSSGDGFTHTFNLNGQEITFNGGKGQNSQHYFYYNG
jgi:hypothetical protein